MEHFAGSCTSICDDPTIAGEVKAACDTGSFNYCAKDARANISDPNCKTYLKRVVGTYTAELEGKVYSNPVKFPVGSTVQISNYYNDMGTAVAKYGTKDIGSLTGQATADLVKILSENNSMYYKDPAFAPLGNVAIDHCLSSTATPNFCSEASTTPSWAVSSISKNVAGIAFKLSTSPGSVVATYNTADYDKTRLLHKKFPNTFKPIENLILSKITKDDLALPFTAELRSYSPGLKVGIDTFVINLINGSKNSFTVEKLEGASLYSASLVNSPMMYDPKIQAFIANIMAYKIANGITETDPFIVLASNTDLGNVQICSSSNPLTTPICKQMSVSAGSTLATSVADATKNFCSNNVNNPDCIKFINSNQTIFNTNDVNTKMLNYCMSNGINDTANCKPFSSINGSADWLKLNTANTKAADGTISAVCGTANGLPKEMCQKVCTTYPELCATDAQDKCSLPAARYLNNTDSFTEKLDEPSYPIDAYDILMWILYIFIAILLSAAGFRLYEYITNKYYSSKSTAEY